MSRIHYLLLQLLLGVCANGLPLATPCAADATAPAESLKSKIVTPRAPSEDVLPSPPSDPAKCDIRLTGWIDKSIAEKLPRLVEELTRDHSEKLIWDPQIYLCLESRAGGELLEGLKIARYLMTRGITTVIEDGTECVSTCALVFMAGTASAGRFGSSKTPSRFLHPRGKLAFHASRGLSSLIRPSYEQGLRELRATISTFYEPFEKHIFSRTAPPSRVKPSLFLEVYSRDYTEWTCVDTVGQIGRWDIQLYGAIIREEATPTMIANACLNAFAWESDFFFDFGADSKELERLGLDKMKINEEKEPVVLKASGWGPFWFWRPPLETTIWGRDAKASRFDNRFVMLFANPASWRLEACVVEVSFNGRKSLTNHATMKIFWGDAESHGFSDRPGFDDTSAPAIAEAKSPAFFPRDTLLEEIAAPRLGGTTSGSATPGASMSPRGLGGVSKFQTPLLNWTMFGCTYRRMSNVKISSCEEECGKDHPKCKAYSFSRVSRTCELKHTLTALRFHPYWTTRVKLGQEPPKKIEP